MIRRLVAVLLCTSLLPVALAQRDDPFWSWGRG